jgi:hypothetical protein
MLLRKRKLHEDDVKMLWSARRTQPPVDCLWCLEPSFPGISVNSDNLSLSYVILFLYSLICHYMHETWSWHAYRYALGFLRKIGCDINRRVITTSPNSRHERLFGRWSSFAWKQQRVGPYFQYFSTSSIWLPFLSLPTNSIKNCTIQLIQAILFTKFHQ